MLENILDLNSFYPFMPVSSLTSAIRKIYDVQVTAYIPASVQLKQLAVDKNTKLINFCIKEITNSNLCIIHIDIGSTYSVDINTDIVYGKDTYTNSMTYIRVSEDTTITDLQNICNLELSLDCLILQQEAPVVYGTYIPTIKRSGKPSDNTRYVLLHNIIINSGYNTEIKVNQTLSNISTSAINSPSLYSSETQTADVLGYSDITDTTQTTITIKCQAGNGKGRIPITESPIDGLPTLLEDLYTYYNTGLTDINTLTDSIEINASEPLSVDISSVTQSFSKEITIKIMEDYV